MEIVPHPLNLAYHIYRRAGRRPCRILKLDSVQQFKPLRYSDEVIETEVIWNRQFSSIVFVPLNQQVALQDQSWMPLPFQMPARYT